MKANQILAGIVFSTGLISLLSCLPAAIQLSQQAVGQSQSK
jgi:hypothetical protein